MIKVFLSVGMKDRTPEAVRADIEETKKYLINYIFTNNEEVEFVDNYDYKGENRVECLGEAIKKMSKCSLVVFINNWFDYTGCRIEHNVCEEYCINHDHVCTFDYDGEYCYE